MKRLAWSIAITFALLGATSGIMRAVFVDDLTTRMDPSRSRAFDALGLTDPGAASRADLLRTVDGRYAEHRAMTYPHVILGAVYLAFGLLQFSGSIRRRYLADHRWAGRALVAIGVVMTLTGMYFGVLVPFAGRAEMLVISIVGILFLFALGRGYVAIRSRDRETHRIWMTRAFGIGLGITGVRLVALTLDLVMTPMGFPPATTFVVSLWVGFGITMLGTEWWLMRTRSASRSVPRVVALETS